MAGESLKVTGGNALGSTIALDAELVIGRSTPGLGSLGGDSEISRVHGRVYHDPSGQLMIEDLGSTNGTFVNGNRISGAQPLRSGDQVRVGQTTMAVEGGAAEGATAVGAIVPPTAAGTPPPPAAYAATPPTQPLPPAQPPAPAFAQQPPTGGPGYAGGPIGGPPGRATGGSKAPWIALGVVVLIALIVGGLAIGGVFSGSDKKNTASTTTTPASTSTTQVPTSAMPPPSAMPAPPSTPPSSNEYPAGFGPAFVEGCARSGRISTSQCRCWFGKLKATYTYPEFLEVVKQARGGTIPPRATQLLRGCLNA
jgi:FHA domain-containing protein